MKKEIVFEFNIIMNAQKEYQLKKKDRLSNGFSCKINGEEFTPDIRIKDSPQLYGGYSNNFTIVRITAKCIKTYPYKYVIIELNNFRGRGEYLLSDAGNECRYEEFYPDNTYKSTLTKNGKVMIIKDDRINFILSGTFEFTAANTTDAADSVIISNGHFNIKF